ncbi:MAG TPA: glucose-6-phosphate dehydrogenase, partial [Acidimicrobiia bacterium]|nr:glucose-6-phosphate dehydrogenase [Acidimicrobiia bacterium]
MTTASGEAVAVSAALVVFGATGDLAHRKLYPALASLAHRGQLPRRLVIVGVSRTRMSDDDFSTEVRNAIAKASDGDAEGRQNILDERGVQYRYIAGSFDDEDTFRRIGEVLNASDAQYGTAGNALYYLATIPQMFGAVTAGLRSTGLAEESEGHFRRIVVEK